MLKIYGLAMSAERIENSIAKIQMMAGVVSADSEQQAYNYALLVAQRGWPKTDGWYGHKAVTTSADDNMVRRAYAALEKATP